MAGRLARRIEIAANIGIVLVCLVLLGSTLARYRSWPFHSQQPGDIRVGERLHIPEADWAAHRSTLVLVFRKDCGYCLESVPFYARLARAASSAGLRVAALLPEPVGDGKSFLESEGIRVDGAWPIAAARPAIRRSPLLLLVNREGTISEVWPGRLPPSLEGAVLKAVESAE